MEQCEKHQECMERIHNNITEIKISNSEIKGELKGFTSSVNEFISSVRKDMYSKDGIMERVGNSNKQMILQWGLLAAIILGMILTYFRK